VVDISADYLVQGAGATCLGFVDSLLDYPSDDSIVIVDRGDSPGGHWNDAYPFVRLHQPAAVYGLASTLLGSGRLETEGLNAGLFDLATRSEVLAHYDGAMRNRFLPSGRVRYFPKCDLTVDADGHAGTIRNMATGAITRVAIRKRLITTTISTEIPSTHPPRFRIAEGVHCIPVNGLASLDRPYAAYTVVGAGKTGIDACIWLLGRGVEPQRISWVMPRDSWFGPRENMQPGIEFFAHNIGTQITATEEIMAAETVDNMFRRFEARGLLCRLDPEVWPTMYRCAIVSARELAQLRRIRKVIRLGRVDAVERDTLVLREGSVPADPDTLYIHCAANAFSTDPKTSSRPRPTFEPRRINLSILRFCQPAFSCALIARIEVLYQEDTARNAITIPVPPPQVPLDWLRMMLISYANSGHWRTEPLLDAWISTCRLNVFATETRGVSKSAPKIAALVMDWEARIPAAAQKMQALIAGAA